MISLFGSWAERSFMEAKQMGWARFLLLGDCERLDPEMHRIELDRLRAQASTRRIITERMDHQLDDLRRENDELKVSLAAVVRILAAKQILTEADVMSVVAASESRDEA